MRLGSHLTVEQKAKDALWHTGRPQSPESRAKISASLCGRPCSPETRARISASEKGKSVPEGFGEHIGALLRGRTLPLETRKKMSASRMGEGNAMWRGGITPENMKIRNSGDYAIWRTSVFVRDGYICQKCGADKGGVLTAHHMDGFSDFPEKRTDIENGITFCEDCHREFHRRYGIKHNRKWQTVEFLSENV